MGSDRCAAGGAAFQGFELARRQILIDQCSGQGQIVCTDGCTHGQCMIIAAAVLVVVKHHALRSGLAVSARNIPERTAKVWCYSVHVQKRQLL